MNRSHASASRPCRRATRLRAKSRLLAVGICLLAAPQAGLAQEYPTKPVRIVLPFPAGGGSDLIARVLAQRLTGALGQQMVVDNRAGASGNIAAELVAKSAADGYTLLFGNSSLSISPAANRGSRPKAPIRLEAPPASSRHSSVRRR